MNTVTCPRCGQRLTVSDHAPPVLTCPRCVARVPNPHARVAGGTEAADVPFATRVSGSPPPLPRHVLPFEHQVERDARRSSYVMFALGTVFAAGAVLSWLAFGASPVGTLLGVVAAVVVAAAILQLRFPENETVQQATGVVGLMAAGCAKVALIIFGVLLLLFGACAVLFATASFH